MMRGRSGEGRYRVSRRPRKGSRWSGRLRRPCPAAGFAVARFLEGEVKQMANLPFARSPGQENHHMQAEDAELEQFRRGVNCAALLEGWLPSWRVDRRESTRRALKYRREEGEVLIVNHDGRGWWDPQSTAKGDIFDLVQYLDPNLNFGQVRRELRRFVGVAPSFPLARSSRGKNDSSAPIAGRWMARPRLRRGSAVWAYLAGTRRLPDQILEAAQRADILREGPYGSAWFAHRDEANAVTHIEIRGPGFKGSLRGGTKTLFRLAGGGPRHNRLVITEAPIDTLSVAAIGISGSFFVWLLKAGGKVGVTPTNRLSSRRTCPKLRFGSRYCTRSKMSPLAVLCGSHQPRPSWLTISTSPASRRYLRARRVLSLRSRRHDGDHPSSSAAQFTPLRNCSSSASSACM